MSVKRLTKRTVDALLPGARNVFLWDDELAGFGLKLTPAGRRVYVVQYRVRGSGPTRRYTIGTHGTYTVDQARNEAKDVLHQAANGVDPNAEQAKHNSLPTVAKAAEEFLAEAKRKRRESTYYEYERHFRQEGLREGTTTEGAVLAAFGRARVSEVTAHQVSALHASYDDRPYAGNRLLALLSVFFGWCERRGYRAVGTNPCRGIERYPEQKRERFLSPDEMRRLGEALRTAQTEGATPAAVAAIRFLSLSGFREMEALSLRWDAIDFERRTITLEISKTGRSVRPLSAAGLSLLSEQPREVGNPYVFPGKQPGSHLVEVRNVWNRVRELAGLESLRMHDLRHSVASVAASSGASLPLIGAVLGHRDVRSTHRYAHLTDDARSALADRTAEEISALMSATPSTSEIRLVGGSKRTRRA